MSSIVSIRIPESLVKELELAVKKEHFLDLSEAVRSIVRKRWMEFKDPSAYQIKQLRSEMKDIIKERSQKSKQETLLEELERIKEMISKEVDE